MISVCSSVATAAAIASALVFAQADAARADSQRQFQGAWVAEGFECADVFAAKGGKTVFKKLQDDTLPGFIVAGDRIRGRTASCSLSSIRRSGDNYAVLLNCQSLIMFGTMSVSVRMKDVNTLERFDPSFPDIRESYRRCGK